MNVIGGIVVALVEIYVDAVALAVGVAWTVVEWFKENLVALLSLLVAGAALLVNLSADNLADAVQEASETVAVEMRAARRIDSLINRELWRIRTLLDTIASRQEHQ